MPHNPTPAVNTIDQQALLAAVSLAAASIPVISLPAPPVFTGTVTTTVPNAQDWLDDLIEWAKQAKRPLRSAMQSCTSGAARQWIRDLVRRNPDVTDEEVSHGFSRLYLPELLNRQFDARRELYEGAVKQSANENLEAFIVRFESKLAEANMSVESESGQNLCILFTKGVKMDLKAFATYDAQGVHWVDYQAMLKSLRAKYRKATAHSDFAKQAGEIPKVAYTNKNKGRGGYQNKGRGGHNSSNTQQDLHHDRPANDQHGGRGAHSTRGRGRGNKGGKSFNSGYNKPNTAYGSQNAGHTGKRQANQLDQEPVPKQARYSNAPFVDRHRGNTLELVRASFAKGVHDRQPSVKQAYGDCIKSAKGDPLQSYYNRHTSWENRHQKASCMMCHSVTHLEQDCPKK